MVSEGHRVGMLRRAMLPLAAILSGTLAVSSADNGTGEWISLFDGKDTAGWTNPYEWGKVAVRDNEIHLTGDRKFFLVTEKPYSDFEFEAEILLPKGKANSGFMFRCHVEKNRVFGYQAEVDGSERRWSGGLYDEGRRGWLWPGRDDTTNVPGKAKTREQGLAHFAKPEVRDAFKRNDWNKYRIVCKGDHIRVFVNGTLVTDVHDTTDAAGPIGIQHHGEKDQTYRFRNLRIRELK